ncbi:hypothetical protein [Hyphomicrobium sp. DY-1]|uniref:hypothetical protein n=1 Tax=Hyphomicrobium sp. DY-1 TaxID=3075650 RepID=UPI0039C11DA1
MPFLVPLITPVVTTALGLGSLGLVGEGIVGIGLSFGVSYLAKKLQPQSTSAGSSSTGMQLSLSYQPNGPRQVPLGVCASAGTLIYHNSYGPNGNDYVQLVYKLGDVPCGGLLKVFANGEQLTLGSPSGDANVSGTAVLEYPGAMWISYHSGDWNQSVDSDLVSKATGGEFLSSYRGRGICYVRVTLKFDQKLYKNGLPAFVFVFQGAKLYDYRKDGSVGGSGSHRWGTESTYEFTENPAVIAYNWYRGIRVNGAPLAGMNVPADFLPLDNWMAAANACDETVNLKAGGTERRYRMGGIVPVDADNASVMRDIVTSMAGSVADCGGIFKLYPGVSQTPVLHITDDDIMSNVTVKYVPKQSRSGLVNAVFGSFNDPSQMYQSTALPPRISPTDEAADGGLRLSQNYGLTYVSSGTQGQRITEILRRQGRFQRNLQFTLSPIAVGLESCDWISWTSRRYGFTDMLFRVVQGNRNPELTVPVEINETSESIFAWNPMVDQLDPNDPATVGTGGAKLLTPTGVALTTTLIVNEDTGVQAPGLRITWDPITDQTVQTLKLEFRKVGSTVALQKQILDPSAGEYTWIDGVQGGVDYEARLDMVTVPKRGTVATGWSATTGQTEPQIVALALLSQNGTPPDTVTPEMLSAQARLELEMSTALASLQGSVQQRLDDTVATLRSAISAIAGISAKNTQLLRSVRAETDGNSIGITEVLEALNGPNGLLAQWSIAIDENGNVTGLVSLSGDTSYTQFSVLADRIVFAMPDGTGQKQIITVGLLADGTTGVGIDASQVIFKGTIKAEHIDTVSLGTVSITDPANTSTLNLALMRWVSTDGKRIFDMKNGVIDWTF